MPSHTHPRRVAVIGSGLAGLTTAYLLKREGVEVWVMEKSERIGFYAASVEIPVDTDEKRPFAHARYEKGQGEDHKRLTGQGRWVVDVPMRSFQGGYYPLLIALYQHLSIPLQTTYYTFSFSHFHFHPNPAAQPELELGPHFVYPGASALVYGAARFLGLAVCHIFWLGLAFLGWHDSLPFPLGRQTPLRDLTSTTAYYLSYPLALISPSVATKLKESPLGPLFSAFIGDIILPLFSAVGTMTTMDVLDTPIGCLLDYVYSTVGTSHYFLGEGNSAADVAERLVRGVKDQGEGYLRLGEEVLDMEYLPTEGKGGEVRVRCKGGDVVVDQVVVATQASAAVVLLGMLENSLARGGMKRELARVRGMKGALGEVEYRETIVVTHRDSTILPPPADTREINLTTPVVVDAARSPLSHPCSNPPDEDNDTPPLSASSSISSASSFTPSTPRSPAGAPYFAPFPDRVYTMGTHVVQPPAYLRDQGMEMEAVLQTTNPVCVIDPDTVLAVTRMERALPTRDPTLFARLHPPLQPPPHAPLVHLSGSYAYPGIPLLEGCVGSAIKAVEAILQYDPQQRGEGGIGRVDWESGRGGFVGRAWRWRRSGLRM